MDQPKDLLVITSYSIHYTKLYEPVTLSIHPGTSGVVTAGREWSRHSLRLDNVAQSRVRVGIAPKGPGRLWVDAVQLEEGTEPAAFRLNPLDAGGAAMAAEAIPTYTLRHTRRPPALDGALDDAAWNRRTRVITSYSIHYTKLYENQ